MAFTHYRRVPFQNFDEAADSLMKITNLLNLLGVKPVLTGLRPETVLQTNRLGIRLKNVMIEANIERALKNIGFTLERNH